MKTQLDIARLNSYSPESPSWRFMAFFTSIILLMGWAIHWNKTMMTASFVVWLLLCGTLLTIDYFSKPKNPLTEKETIEYILSLDVPILVAATQSPEIRESVKRLILKQLNANHPGWSFE